MSAVIEMTREIEAAKTLRDQLATICNDDPDFLRDVVEGETSVRELIAILVAEEGEDKAMIDGLDRYIESLKARKSRIEGRIDTRRALLGSALEIAGLTKLETHSGTVALSKVQPKVIVLEESEIPTTFWKAGKPTLDKKALGEALKAGDTIPGATLSNGGLTTTIRRS